jgi:D-beta-D-heptose 7-phosphate kinase/D-beta-D-heptose 1-phosphate adenosyltransferase
MVVGDAMLDRDVEGRAERIAPDAPVPVVRDGVTRSRAGGAALAAVLLAADGHDVTLVTALGDDDAGRTVVELCQRGGVRLVDAGRSGPTPEKIRVRADGQTLVRVDHDDPAPSIVEPDQAAAALAEGAGGVLVADYGRGVAATTVVRATLEALMRHTPLVWDPHPLGPPPVPGCVLVTPNRSEVTSAGAHADSVPAAASAALVLCARWHARAVAITLGADGAVLGEAGLPPYVVPAPFHANGDPCGAGDRFASYVVSALAGGHSLPESVLGAVRVATEFVAAGGASVVAADDAHAHRSLLSQRNVATTVATSGCFDLLHAGHVACLEAARALGDRLVVLLNSDASTRRLKGPGRPLVPAADRAAVLRGLECVDEVVIFDEDTPLRALERLKPILFVKGGDYAGVELPEQQTMARWGGRVVIVPYLAGRSTTRLVEEARGAA